MTSLTKSSSSVAAANVSCQTAQKKSYHVGRRILLTLMIALASLTGFVRPLAAQFTGPALTTPPPSHSTPVPTTSTTVLYPKNPVIYLSPGDVVAVHLYGSAEYAPIVRVSLDSTMQLPLIGVISVKGLTIDQTEDLIAKRLKQLGMYLDPQVTIEVTESIAASVTLTGEAHAVVPVTGQRSLLEVLALAGGLPATASRIVSIDRPGVANPIVVDLGTDPLQSKQANIPVYPGDTIVTSRVGVVYLLGDFHNVGAIPIVQSSPLTLLQVASLGGGPRNVARYSQLRIIRTNGTERSLIHVDLMKVMKGHAPDPILQADDIVYLPDNLIKDLLSNGGAGVLVGLASVALYAVPIL